MTIKLSKARQLCTTNEYNLILWSSQKKVQELTPSQLKQKIDRARKLRDKYRKLAQSQRREARGKQAPRRTRAAMGNENTEIKAQVFAESLDRFEKALAKAEGTSTTTKKTTKKTAKKSSKNTTAKKKTTKKKSTTAAAKKTSKKAATKSRKKTSSTGGASRKSKKKKQKSASAKSPVAAKSPTGSVIAPAVGAGRRKPASITAEPTPGSPFGMQGTGTKAELESRKTRRQNMSKQARIGTVESQFARTNKDKIQGHVSAQTKRNQAKRDS